MMKIYGDQFFNELSIKAIENKRQRQFFNVHNNHLEPCQRLFNAIEPESYIRPHRHFSDPKDEMLCAVRGSFVVVLFDSSGNIEKSYLLGNPIYRFTNSIHSIEIPFYQWHTVISIEKGSVLLEIKSGPFNENLPKDLADWAPDENNFSESKCYIKNLLKQILY